MLKIETYTGGIAATNGYACHVNGWSFAVDAPEGMAAWLENAGVVPRALLLTHAHFDHVLDAAKVQKHWNCPVYAYADPAPELTLEYTFAAFGPALNVAPYRVDHHLAGETTLALNGLSIDILHIPGHSPDSVAFLFRDAGVVFAGDVLMQGGIGRDDLPGGDGSLLRQGIREKLYVLDDEVQVLPGHGGPTSVGEEKRSNPFVRS